MAQPMSALGLDIAKQVFHAVGMDDRGHVVLRKRLSRRAWLPLSANVPPRRMGMEAWGRAHDWARRCREHGHDGRLIAPPFLKASVKSPKNDARDADASCAAVSRPTMRVVPIKRVAQQALQALHRVRARLLKARTALVKEIRGLLSEDGIVRPPSIAKFRAWIVAKREDAQAKLTALGTEVCWPLYEELLALERRLASDDAKLAATAQAHPDCQRRQTIPGIGPGTATALIAAIGDAPQVKNGRPLAAWLGVVPREHSTGGQPRLLGVSKRGEGYVRQLLVHGARATPRWGDAKSDDRRRWLSALMARRGKHRAAVALANQNARIGWALLAHNEAYRVSTAASAGGASAVIQDTARPCEG
jgi:transposase